MHKTLLLMTSGVLLVSANALADDLSMPQVAEPQTTQEAMPSATTAVPAAAPMPGTLPRKGEEMSQVVKEFGEPKVKHPAVGGGQPRQPPITRWDYDDFSVIFENTHVVDAVVPDHPSTIHHQDELKPVTP